MERVRYSHPTPARLPTILKGLKGLNIWWALIGLFHVRIGFKFELILYKLTQLKLSLNWETQLSIFIRAATVESDVWRSSFLRNEKKAQECPETRRRGAWQARTDDYDYDNEI